MALEQLWEGQYSVAAPVVGADGTVFCTCSASGLVLKLAPKGDGSGSTLVPVLETNGTPTGLAQDPTTQELFVADQARRAILKVEGADPQLVQFVEQFEGLPLRGPTRLCFDREGELFFTDSGPLGDTGLANPRGAVFRTVQGRQQLVHVIGPSLAQPSGICAAADGSIFVCELMTNRLLRFVQHPPGVYHGSVFAQLCGGLGATDVAVHPRTGDIYVAKFDLQSLTRTGVITVLQSTGEEKGSITIPGPEISGICFDSTGSFLYIAEQSQKRLYRFKTAA